MTLRRARVTDTLVLAELHQSIFPGNAWDEAFWRGAVRAAFDHVLVLGSPVRAFALVRAAGGEAELLTIGTVDPGRGDGSALLAGALVLARSAGAERLFLEVSAVNKAALHLYRNAGFVEVGVRPRYYNDGSDAVQMRLDLATGED